MKKMKKMKKKNNGGNKEKYYSMKIEKELRLDLYNKFYAAEARKHFIFDPHLLGMAIEEVINEYTIAQVKIGLKNWKYWRNL